MFMDLAKAFDTVNQDILSYELNQYEIRGLAFDLIKSYLQHRKQIVQVGNHSSYISGINISVPHGSVFRPTSDLKVTLYAADSLLFLAHKNIDSLQKVDRWLNVANKHSVISTRLCRK